MRLHSPSRPRLTTLTLVLLVIEFLDEFVYGAREAAWPLLRADLGLNYAEVGLLLSLPQFISSLVEPVLGILGDTGRRRLLILGGGTTFAAALGLTALSQNVAPLLLSFILLYPASGAFVSLSQATLMDSDPARREQNMARWTFAGSLGVVGGPLILSAAVAVGAGWRGLFLFLAALTLLPLGAAWRFPLTGEETTAAPTTLRQGVANALVALRQSAVWRWLVLLQCSDLLLDVLLGFLALYCVDVVKVTSVQAGMAVAVWSGVGLLGDFLLIPLLERVRGLVYLRYSAAVELVIFVAFLITPGWWPKLILLGALGFANAGWYSVLKAQLYAALPGQSGTSMALDSLSGLVGGLIPLGLGLVAERWGLQVTLWLLLIGPLALLAGLPRQRNEIAIRD